MSALTNFNKFINDTYSGKQLLEHHSLDEEGMWEIRGEDPNCDLGGSHHQPKLGIVQGKLRDVIMYGVDLPGFWQWGAGGNFESIGVIPKIDSKSIEVRNELLAEEVRLIRELKAVQERLRIHK